MSVVALDTHAVVKQLLAAGFTDAQAEAVTKVVRDAQDVDLSALATKSDLAATRAELAAGLAAAKVDLAETKADILKWMIGSMMGLQTIVIIGAILSLTRLLPH